MHRCLVQTFGAGRELTQIPAGGTRFPTYPQDDSLDHTARSDLHTYRGVHFQMDGESTLRFIGARMPSILEQLQPSLSRGLGSIRWVVPHQASGLGASHRDLISSRLQSYQPRAAREHRLPL